jgi:hypothetical protein
MKKVIRLTESELTNIVKRVINEQREVVVEMLLMECFPKELLKYDPQSGEKSPPKNFLLDTLMEATDSFNDGGAINWDEEKIVKALEGSTIKDANLVQKVLRCLLPKIEFRELQDNNPLLTICRIVFTNSLMGVSFTDPGDQELKMKAQKALKKIGINTNI